MKNLYCKHLYLILKFLEETNLLLRGDKCWAFPSRKEFCSHKGNILVLVHGILNQGLRLSRQIPFH